MLFRELSGGRDAGARGPPHRTRPGDRCHPLERIEDPVERQLQPTPPRPVPQQRQPALHQQSGSSSIGAVNAALGTVTGITPGDGDCALRAAAGIGHAQLGPEELAAANAAAGALRTALLQHARAQSDGYRQQAGTLGWGPAEWARHAAAATYTATGEPGAAGAPALELIHSSEYLPPELMPSLAACIGADIAVLTRDIATGDIRRAAGTGAVIQVPLHWRLLADRLGQQPRASGSGDLPVAPLRVVMFDGHFDATSGRHRGHFTAILPEQQCHLDRRDGNSGSHRGPETRLGTSQPDDPQ
jgi:hypothetical protein